MGKFLYEEFSIAKQTFEEGSDALSLDLKKLCFDGSEADLALTENTQPCLLLTSTAVFRVLSKEFDFKPQAPPDIRLASTLRSWLVGHCP